MCPSLEELTPSAYRVTLPASAFVALPATEPADRPYAGTFFEQIAVYASEDALGLPVTPGTHATEIAERLPFWPAMLLLARLQREVHLRGRTPSGQADILA